MAGALFSYNLIIWLHVVTLTFTAATTGAAPPIIIIIIIIITIIIIHHHSIKQKDI